MHDTIYKPKGTLHLRAVDLNGKTMWEETRNNLVVDLGLQQLAHLIGGDVATRSITQIGVGTNGGPTAAGNTGLTGSFVKACGAISYPSQKQVKIQFLIDYADANGMTIQEWGLITAGNNLFSRLLWGPIAKTSAFTLVGAWTIDF